MMFEIGKTYKVELELEPEKHIIYTGIITKESEEHIEIATIRHETIIVNKNRIVQCKLLKQNSEEKWQNE